RHKMDKKEFRTIGVPGYEVRKMDNAPFDLPAVHIFKIWGGQVHEIEALGFVAPYNSATGWENCACLESERATCCRSSPCWAQPRRSHPKPPPRRAIAPASKASSTAISTPSSPISP